MNKPAASHDETTPSHGGIPVRRLAVPLGVLTASAAAFAALMYVPRVESPPLASANVKKAESVPTSEVSAQIDPNSFVDAFGPTVPNNVQPSSSVPDGMVWIPGGEFSMGSNVDSESLCSLPGVTRDAAPIHRV
jgi:formylglycine-generating enzyme required for sulfatase activity